MWFSLSERRALKDVAREKLQEESTAEARRFARRFTEGIESALLYENDGENKWAQFRKSPEREKIEELIGNLSDRGIRRLDEHMNESYWRDGIRPGIEK